MPDEAQKYLERMEMKLQPALVPMAAGAATPRSNAPPAAAPKGTLLGNAFTGAQDFTVDPAGCNDVALLDVDAAAAALDTSAPCVSSPCGPLVCEYGSDEESSYLEGLALDDDDDANAMPSVLGMY